MGHNKLSNLGKFINKSHTSHLIESIFSYSRNNLNDNFYATNLVFLEKLEQLEKFTLRSTIGACTFLSINLDHMPIVNSFK